MSAKVARGRRDYEDKEEEEQHKATGGKASRGKANSAEGDNAKCKRCSQTGHKSVRYPDQICGVCGGKDHSVEICAIVVTVLACGGRKDCKDDSDAAISGEEKGAFKWARQVSSMMSRMMMGWL